MVIDFIPIYSYNPLYFHILLVIVLMTFVHTHITNLGSGSNIAYFRVMGFVLFTFTILYMGMRPIHGVFTDMKTYYKFFNRYANGGALRTDSDVFFHQYMFYSAKIMSANTFFFLCATIYIVPTYAACRKWFNQHWFYPFLAIVGSFTFWAYGTNGIRNGMASSLFIYALSRDKRIWQFFWMWIVISIHKSMLIPVAGYIITQFYNKPRYLYYFWVLSIPLSLALPGFWQTFFAGLAGGNEGRAGYLTEEVNASKFSSTGFRWDFLFYSASGVFAGWYYIFRKNFSDTFYVRLYNIFLFANAFWILVIRANYSNRFAYLSWFMLALVIFYPLLKEIMLKEQHKKIGIFLLLYFGFTYFMNVLIK